MRIQFIPGQLVRLIGVPASLPADTNDLPTSAIFQACLGRTFRVVEIDQSMVALNVGEVVGQPPWKHTIYVEPEFLEPAAEW